MIFVSGSSRSGTTMMGRILNNSPEVNTFGELHFFGQQWSEKDKSKKISQDTAVKLFATLISIARNGYYSQIDFTPFIDEASIAVKSFHEQALYTHLVFKEFLFYETKRHNKKIPCEQTPINVFYIKEILELYPEARIIHMVRDLRDVLISQKKRWKRRFLGGSKMPMREVFRSFINYHPVTTSMIWNSTQNQSKKYKSDPRVIIIRYEDLILQPDVKPKEIFNFLGVPYSEEFINVPQVGSSSKSDSPDSLGLNKTRVFTWKQGGLDSAEIFLAQLICKSNLIENNYEIKKITPNVFLLMFYLFIFPIKSIIAFLMNLGKSRNIFETIKRRLFSINK